MANTSGRTLKLLSLLQNHRYWPGTELAGRLGVSPRTLRRDVGRLRDLGYPVRAHPGVDGGYQLAAGADLPPLVIDDDEAVAVAVALHAAAAAGGPENGSGGGSADTVAEASVRALAKLSQVMPARLRQHAAALTSMTVAATWAPGAGSPAVAPATLTVAALACRDTERIRFGYTAASGDRTDRYVEPHRLVSLAGRWYLVGYDLTRQDWRNFRLDRVENAPRGTGERFAARTLPAPDAATFVRESIGSAWARYEIKAVVEAPAEETAPAIGRWASVEPVSAGRCRVRMTAENLDWPLMLLGLAGADFRIESPPELAERAGQWARRFAAAR
ncbi:MAG: WYL domain-containing protein [Streptosporangiales bacterium]|nr:WYL domain-containing protein [Streptosporangiales bacterium]